MTLGCLILRRTRESNCVVRTMTPTELKIGPSLYHWSNDKLTNLHNPEAQGVVRVHSSGILATEKSTLDATDMRPMNSGV